MTVLGISAFVHDSGACIVKDGRLIANIEEERLNRKKHTDEFPRNAISYVLAAAGIDLDAVDVVAFNWNPWKSLWAELAKAILLPFIYYKTLKHNKPPKSFKSIIASFRLRSEIERHFPGKFRGRIRWVEHHRAHAASSYYLSGFNTQDALVLVVDGHGESCASTVFAVQGTRFKTLRAWPIFDSLGILYTNFTYFLGFGAYQEGKTMALASFGRNTFGPVFSRIIRLESGGSYTLANKRYLGLWNYDADRLDPELGVRRQPGSPLKQAHFDIACSMQTRIKETVLHILDHFRLKAGVGTRLNLCLAGGVFLNCDINSEIVRTNHFAAVFAPPFTSDSGGAIGAALYVAGSLHGEFSAVNTGFSPYLGPEYSTEEIVRSIGSRGLEYSTHDQPWMVAAEALQDNKVVAWFQGRAESGPRALGNRSILANPSNPGIQNHLNRNIKKREDFRPFAPICTPEAAILYFDLSYPLPDLTRYMLMTVSVREQYRDALHGVTHVDGTARIQVVYPNDNPALHALLVEFGRYSGFEVLVNTSFNREEPIVCSPDDAINCFRGAGIDLLCMGSVVVYQTAATRIPQRQIPGLT